MPKRSTRKKEPSQVGATLPADLDALLPEERAARFLSLTSRTLQAWRQRGGGPVFCRISSRCVRYRLRDLIAFAESRLRTSTAA